MDYSKLTKTELLVKCDEFGIKKCKSKTKPQLIELIQNKLVNNEREITTNNPSNVYNLINTEEDEHSSLIQLENMDSNIHQYKYIDLFCGIGGFHQALDKLGKKCILACDIDKDCRIVYKDNYNIEPIHNIK